MRTFQLRCAKRVLRYLIGTLNRNIRIPRKSNSSPLIITFTDADFAPYQTKASSTGGRLHLLLHQNSYPSDPSHLLDPHNKHTLIPIDWTSKLLPLIACSTTEAELLALNEGAKDCLYLQQLLQELRSPDESLPNPTIFCDNARTIDLLKGKEIYRSRTRHLNLRHFFVRELLQNKSIQLFFCPTRNMLADSLTKSLPLSIHNFLINSFLHDSTAITTSKSHSFDSTIEGEAVNYKNSKQGTESNKNMEV